MKVLCSILLAVIVLHAQCGASCLGYSKLEPSCHKKHNAQQQEDNSCRDGVTLDSKSGPKLRGGDAAVVAPDIASVIPVRLIALPETVTNRFDFYPSSPPITTVILRI